MSGKKSSGNSTSRARNWMVIVYPDSAPAGWEQIIDDLHIEWCCSPLHDADTLPTGESKKPHWHVILTFEGVKTPAQVQEITDKLHTVPPKRLESIRGAVRYLIHMDSPDKAPYERDGIRVYGGMEIDDYLRSSEACRQNVVRDMCRWCIDNHITEFWALMQYAMDNEPDWWDSLTNNSAYLMDKFVSSRRNWYCGDNGKGGQNNE